MIPFSERLHIKRLNSKNIVIEDRFLKDTGTKKEILVRATDHLRDDVIINRPRLEKVYFLNNKGIFLENDFDKNIDYTYIVGCQNDEIFTCPSCGYKDKSSVFSFGCPYCNSDFYIDFSHKKRYHIEPLIDKNLFIKAYITSCGVIAIPLFITSFEFYVIPFSLLLAIPLFPFTYFVISCIYNSSNQNIKQQINKNHEHNRIYNDLSIELNNYYYNDKNVQYKDLIDYDIKEYLDIKNIIENNNEYIQVSYIIRKYYLQGETIKKTQDKETARLIRNKSKKTKEVDMKCRNCGATLKFDSRICEYCESISNLKNDWLLDSFVQNT